jgi:transcriptional regulator with XRE-family HTH domain
MGRASANDGARSDFSKRVVANVEQLRDEARLSNSDLIEAAGFSRNYYYTRMRLEASFTTDDVARLADALRTDPDRLTAPAEQGTRFVRLDARKLAGRLHQLVASANSAFVLDELTSAVSSQGAALPVEDWEGLLNPPAQVVRASERVLLAIAQFFRVDPRYLLDARFDEVASRVEAELDVKAALRDKGIDGISFRTLGAVSPEALRAIAEAIREGQEGTTSQGP